MDGRYGRPRLVGVQHADPTVYSFQLLHLAGQTGGVAGQSGGRHGSPAAPDRSAEADSDAQLDGRADRGGSETATAAGCRYFPHHAVYGDAQGVRGHAPSQTLGWAVGLTTGAREGRTDKRHSLAGVGYALSPLLRRAMASTERPTIDARNAALLVRLGTSSDRIASCADDREEYLASVQTVRAADRLSDAEAA